MDIFITAGIIISLLLLVCCSVRWMKCCQICWETNELQRRQPMDASSSRTRGGINNQGSVAWPPSLDAPPSYSDAVCLASYPPTRIKIEDPPPFYDSAIMSV